MDNEQNTGANKIPQYTQQWTTPPVASNSNRGHSNEEIHNHLIEDNNYDLCEDVVETPHSPLRRDRPLSYKKHKTKRFTYLDAGFILNGVGTYIFDVVTDVLACIKYFSTGDFWWAFLTTVFILVSSITVQAASFRWFIDDYTKGDAGNMQNKARKPMQGLCRKAVNWLVWIIAHVLQLGTVNRYLRCLYFGWKSRKSQRNFDKYYIWKVFEQRDLTMLRLIEAFMESGPQLVLQIYIMLRLYLVSELPKFYWITALSAVSSLLSLSWALEAYHKALRESLDDKRDITYSGVAVRYIWRVAMITSRVTAMALFALHFKWVIFPVVLVHWVLMVIWLVSQKTEFYDSKTEERLFCCVIAIVHIFCFFNMKEGRTRLRMAIYYILIFFENVAMTALWYYFSGTYLNNNYGLMALSVVGAGFSIGILTMLVYYVFVHPNRNHKTHTEIFQNGTEATVEGAYFRDIPDGAGNHKQNLGKSCGNMFRKDGRRYIHWIQENDLQEIGDENQNITDQKLTVEHVKINANNKYQSSFSQDNTFLLYETSV